MMVWNEAIRPITAIAARILAISVPNRVRNPSSSGSPDLPRPAAPGAMPVFRKSTRNAETISVRMPAMMPLGMSRLRIVRFLRRERQLLDGEEQPHREGQRGEDAADP